jgi:hypothetical protein
MAGDDFQWRGPSYLRIALPAPEEDLLLQVNIQ